MRLSGKLDHQFSAAHFVGEVTDGLDAFGVGDDRRIGKLDTGFLQRLYGEENVGVTAAGPELHLATGFLGDPLAEVLVGHEKNFPVGGHLVDDLDRVAAGADDVAERLHRGGAVDVGDDVEIGMRGFVGGELFGGARIGE